MNQRPTTRRTEHVAPFTARFVVFFNHAPQWFYDYASAVAFADEWGIPSGKIHRTSSAH
ncbi:hypothetical protein [Streptomyces goshikiensis]|uniref:hypothetical protein n=1 Tax=Streptomyces goshikiensis TaxID=1942 RepID=UPI0037110C83